MRKLFRNIHLWLSVPFGLIIMLTCFSGAMLVFEKEMTEWARPEVFRVDPQGRQPLPVAEVVRRVSTTLPEDITVTGVTVFSDPAKAWQLPLSQPSRMSVYADPYTGDVTGCSERLPFLLPCSVCTAGCSTAVPRATASFGVSWSWVSAPCCSSSCFCQASLSGGRGRGKRCAIVCRYISAKVGVYSGMAYT